MRMTTARTCLRTHSSIDSTTRSAGVAITARSTSAGMSSRLGKAGRPQTTWARSLTAQTVPAKRWASRLYTTSWPSVPGVEPAPTTATLEGVNRRRTEAAEAVASRRSRAASASGVGWSSKDTSMTPSANCRLTSKPADENTMSILVLSGRTDAVKRARPCSRAAATRYSRNTLARPR